MHPSHEFIGRVLGDLSDWQSREAKASRQGGQFVVRRCSGPRGKIANDGKNDCRQTAPKLLHQKERLRALTIAALFISRAFGGGSIFLGKKRGRRRLALSIAQ